MNAMNTYTACRHYFQLKATRQNCTSFQPLQCYKNGTCIWWCFVLLLFTTCYITPSCDHLLIAIVMIIRPFDHVLYASHSVTTTTWVPS